MQVFRQQKILKKSCKCMQLAKKKNLQAGKHIMLYTYPHTLAISMDFEI